MDDIGEKLNEIALDGFCDDQCGSVETGLWSGKINLDCLLAIIQEDDQGFFDYMLFDSESKLDQEWDRIVEIESKLTESEA